MAYEDPNAPNTTSGTSPATVSKSEKKSSSWDWIWPALMAVVIFRLIGLVGGLVAFGSYYWLKPKLGTLGAVLASGGIGVVVALGFLAMIL